MRRASLRLLAGTVRQSNQLRGRRAVGPIRLVDLVEGSTARAKKLRFSKRWGAAKRAMPGTKLHDPSPLSLTQAAGNRAAAKIVAPPSVTALSD